MSTDMVNFEITSDLTTLRGQVIDANFEQVKEWLEENLAPFTTMVVTGDDISGAKTYRANIRKIASRIDESRKEAKAAALAAYDAFEAKCKELTALCAEAADNLDRQIKGFEEKERNEKIARLRLVYHGAADEELREFCPWEYIFNAGWGNKGYSELKAEGEIKFALERAREDLAAIRGMDSEFVPSLLDSYKQSHDLGVVLRKAAMLRQLKEQEAQRERQAAQSPHTPPAADRSAEDTPEAARQGVPAGKPEEELLTIDFRVTGTAYQLTELKRFLKDRGIRYGRVPEK